MPITADIGIKTKAELRGTQIDAIKAITTDEKKLVRVGCYARTSSDLPCQEGSIEFQEVHLRHLVESTPNWTLVDMYVDEGLSGTDNANRPAFQRMMADCRAGKIDMIITKSISRWGRSASQSLKALQELYDLDVDVYFEREKIHSKKGMNNLLLELMSSFSEFESKSIKLNTKMGYKHRMASGTYKYTRPPYGYDVTEDGELVVNPQEAATVRRIFELCLEGVGSVRISNILNAEGIPTKRSSVWQPGTIRAILANITYTGDVLLQKTIRIGNAPRIKNDGQEDQYYVTEHHEPIISHEIFDAAQKALTTRARGRTKGDGKSGNRYAFSGKLTCAHCGHHLHRFQSPLETLWICTGHRGRGCPQKQVSDLELKSRFKAIVGDIDHLLAIQSEWMADEGPAPRLLANLTQQEAMRTLQTVLSPAEFTRRMNTLQREETALRQQMMGSTNQLVEELKRQCHQVPKNPKWSQVEPIFIEQVESVSVWADGRLEFKFVCGLTILSPTVR